MNTTNPETVPKAKEGVQDLSPLITSLNGQGPLFAAFLTNVLTPEECADLIRRSDDIGYEQALLNAGNGKQVMDQDVRLSDRCIMDDPHYTEMLYQRILAKLGKGEAPKNASPLLKPLLNWNMEDRQHAVGLNERLRILRYGPGGYFKPHSDGSYRRGREAGRTRYGETSRVSVLLYLNEGYKGGNTRFINYWDGSIGHQVVPKTGSVLLFEHPCCHDGATLEEGCKYVVRTDLMYTQKGPGHEYSKGL